ncbi:MAG: luciferase family protein, partial [Nitrososphaerales archaeon]
LSKEDYKRVIEEGKAEEHRFAWGGRWVTIFLKSKKDVETAKELVDLAYGTAKELVERRGVRAPEYQNLHPER